MEPIPYYYDSIDRNAIVIKPKKPLFDWINYIYPKNPVTEVDEGTVYLIHGKDNNGQIERWLMRNFDKIFQNELNDWHTDENDWPQKRTFKIFKEWFDYEIHSVILDIEDDRIFKRRF